MIQITPQMRILEVVEAVDFLDGVDGLVSMRFVLRRKRRNGSSRCIAAGSAR
jgi:hypothetical protein